MKRHMWFVLLLATGGVFVHGTSNAGQAAAAQTPRQGEPRAQSPATGAKPAAAADLPQDAPPSERDKTDGPSGEAQTPAAGDAKLTSVPGSNALGMSILGNQEAPKSLVIVPWKTSELGGSPGVSLLLDDSRQPVDKDVFMRALRYHEISSGATGGRAAADGREKAAESDATQSSTAPRRR